MDKDTLVSFGIVLEIISAFAFLIAIIVAIANKKYRKQALITLIISVVTFIIGFSTCSANFTLKLN